MASSNPHKTFLITEILEMILLKTDMRTVLTSAQRVCRKWHGLIKDSTNLQEALFFKPVRSTLPRGVPGIRNPLLADCIWPWFCGRHARKWGAPPMEAEVKLLRSRPHHNKPFFREGASWERMLFQQPPRSCIGLVEKDGKAFNGPAYTEFKVQPDGDYLRIGDIVDPCTVMMRPILHPLPEEGLLWIGEIHTEEQLKRWRFLAEFPPMDDQHGKILQTQVAYAKSIYLQDCDVVFFTLACGRARGQFIREYDNHFPAQCLDVWLRDMRMSLMPGQISIPMPVT